MTLTRRTVIKTGLAIGASACLPGLACWARARP